VDVFLVAVNEFKNDENLKYSFYDYLPLEEVKDEFFLPVVEQIYEKLKEEECILTESNRWKKPSEVLVGDEEIKRIVTNEDLQGFFGKEYLSERIKAKKQILGRLGVRDFLVDDLIMCLENTEWIKNQNEGWFASLFYYLSKKKLSNKQLERLESLKIIKMENGKLSSTGESVIFFPLKKKEAYGFESELRIIQKEIIENILEYKKEERSNVLEFLKKLGMKQADPYEIVENHILPVYENGEWKQKDSKVLMGYIRYIKDNIDKYERESDKRLNADKSSWEPKEDPLKRLKESLLIRIDKDDEGEEWYDNPENVYLPKIYGNENELEKLFEGIDVSFVHPCYIEEDVEKLDKEISEKENKLKEKCKKWKKKHRKEVKKIEEQIKKLETEKDKKVKEWKEFFFKISVNEIPKVEYYEGSVSYNDKYPTEEEKEYSTWGHNVKDWRLSKEFERLLRTINLKRAKILLTIMDKYWSVKYQNYLEMKYSWFYYSEHYKTLSSSFIRDLKEKIRILTALNQLAKPSGVFLDKPNIREVLGDTVPYLAVKIENEDLIKTLGINTQANVDGVLNYLKSLIEQKSKDKEKFEKLYKFLDEHFEEDITKIKEEFVQNLLIFVPDTEKNYYSSREVIWKDVSSIFGGNRIYLEKYYPKELRKFFVEKLGISEKPTPKDYADVLCSLSEKSEISNEDKKVIVRIYEELNRNLNTDKVEKPISEEDWWEDFIKRPVFLTDKGEFWSNDGDIFINDNNEFYELFEDEEDIGFLWLPEGYHPDKIRFLIESCNLRYLSKSIETNPLLEDTTYSKDEKLTQLIQTIISYILRYLYWRENRVYEELKENGKLVKIMTVKVYVTKNLKIKYPIKVNEWRTVNKEAERECIYHNSHLYLRKNYGNIYVLAIEFSKAFGEIKGLDDFVMNIMNDPSHAEDIMKAKNIGELPQDEKEILEKISERQTKEAKEIERKIEEPKVSEEEKREFEKDSFVDKSVEETSFPRSTELSEKISRVTEEISDETTEEKEWIPEFSPEEVPIKIKEYNIQEPKMLEEETQEKIKLHKESYIIKTQTPSTQPHKTLGKKAKEDIGRWGEEYAFLCIKNELVKKYSNASLVDTEQGFRLEKDGSTIVEVIWLNKKEESRKHYDIKITEDEEEIFIEVKSTKELGKAWFQVSKDQWRLMEEKGDKFYIYRVYGAGTEEAKIEKISNPAKLWKEGHIDAYPIGIEL